MEGSRCRVKVCGLTTVADAVATAQAGADWIGLNFHPTSKRYLSPERASEIVAALPSTVEAVGLFVDRPPAEVAEAADRLGLRLIQLHGDEPPEELARLRRFRVVKAFRIGDRHAIDAMMAYLERTKGLGAAPEAVLVDAFVEGQPGGTGQTIGEDLLGHLPPLPRLILAGGLTPENLADRIGKFRPWMVDVAGGVESSPGRKDPSRVAAFVKAARRGAFFRESGREAASIPVGLGIESDGEVGRPTG